MFVLAIGSACSDPGLASILAVVKKNTYNITNNRTYSCYY